MQDGPRDTPDKHPCAGDCGQMITTRHRYCSVACAAAAKAGDRPLSSMERVGDMAQDITRDLIDAKAEPSVADRASADTISRAAPPSYMDRIVELAKGIDPYQRWSEPAPQQIVPDLAWLDQILDGIDTEERERDTGWWSTSAGAAFGARRLAELKAEITRRFYHQTTTVHVGAWTPSVHVPTDVRAALADLSPAAREFVEQQSGKPYRFGSGDQS